MAGLSGRGSQLDLCLETILLRRLWEWCEPERIRPCARGWLRNRRIQQRNQEVSRVTGTQKTRAGSSHTLPLPGASLGAVWLKLRDAKVTSEPLVRGGSKPGLSGRSPCPPWPGFQPARPPEPVSAAAGHWDPQPRQPASPQGGGGGVEGLLLKLGSGSPAHQHL